jgi:hypothetical protein
MIDAVRLPEGRKIHVARSVVALALALVACAAPSADNPLHTSVSPAASTEAVGNPGPLTTDAAWASLAARPLRLASVPPGAPCPTSSFVPLAGSATSDGAGDGPIYPVVGGGVIGLRAANAQSFETAKVMWVARPDYTGIALIRGRRLDADGEVIYMPGSLDALRFELQTNVRAGSATDGSAIGWRYLPSNVYLRAPGCYGFQIDAPNWTATVILSAVPTTP